jgi:hypothetical protein
LSAQRSVLVGAYSQFLQFVFDFEFLAFESRNRKVVVADVAQFVFDLAFDFPMAAFQRRNVAFSRHDNSFEPLGPSMLTQNRSACRPSRLEVEKLV